MEAEWCDMRYLSQAGRMKVHQPPVSLCLIRSSHTGVNAKYMASYCPPVQSRDSITVTAQAQGDPARVQLAYERAVAVFPVTHYLWSQYAKYMEQNLGRMPQLVHAVYQRALRNCPWVGSLWAGALRATERLGSPHSDLESLYDRALQAGMQTQEDYMDVSMPKWTPFLVLQKT